MESSKRETRYTYEDLLSWPGDTRYELIDGVPYAMAPAPNLNHQRLSAALMYLLYAHLEGKPCEVFSAPFDLRFSEENETDTVVQPDIAVVCDEEKKRKNGIVGAPNLIIEILSPSTAIRDFTRKRLLYEQKGVNEYWIVAPQNDTITQYVLTDGRYVDTIHTGGTLESAAVRGFVLDMDALFARLPKSGEDENERA